MKKSVLFFVVFSVFLTGCADFGKRGGFIDSINTSAVSVLGYQRLSVLSLDERERQILENNLQKLLTLNLRASEYGETFPRNDGSVLNTKALVGAEFVPQSPVGLRCRGLHLSVATNQNESFVGEGTMCLDILDKVQVWKKYLKIPIPAETMVLPKVKAGSVNQPLSSKTKKRSRKK